VVRDETIAIHGSYLADGTRAVAVPIYQTVAHDFVDAAHAGAVFDLETPGFHYNRINNPTVDVLERRMTSLEQGVGAVAFSFTEPPTRPGNKTSSRRGTNNEPPATSVGRTNP
jgi:O-acetylhomoserine (thiol)-lyase